MAQKFYNLRQAAEVLGVSEDDVKSMIQRRELHGYRDGADWKFKVEQVDQLASERGAGGSNDESALVSEVELGGSEIGASGKIIGGKPDAAAAGESDLALDVSLDDAALEDSRAGGGRSKSREDAGADDSALDLAGAPLEDDDVLLGGSGAGSDVTIGGDSGISLVDPADSGLSLEEPLELGAGDDESLELGEEDMLSLAEASDLGAGLAGDDDFLLTPMDEGADAEDSESGSQVIALDEGAGDEAATVIAGGGMGAMLDEDFGGQPLGPMGAPLGPAAAGSPQAGAVPLDDMAFGLPETPYTAWNVVSLVLVTIVLVLCGMFTYDLLRNMWSWDSPYPVTSSTMDWILSLFEK